MTRLDSYFHIERLDKSNIPLFKRKVFSQRIVMSKCALSFENCFIIMPFFNASKQADLYLRKLLISSKKQWQFTQQAVKIMNTLRIHLSLFACISFGSNLSMFCIFMPVHIFFFQKQYTHAYLFFSKTLALMLTD